jgi:hypothetical protein
LPQSPDAPLRPADDGQHHIDFLAVPHYDNGHRTAAQSPQMSGNIRGRRHLGVFHLHDHVACFDAGLVGRRTRRHRTNENTLFYPEELG